MTKAIYMIGTDTDVGKTYVSGLLTKALLGAGKKAGYFKPILSGATQQKGQMDLGDVKEVCERSGLLMKPNMNVYAFLEGVSPHLAAAHEGKTISLGPIRAGFERIKKDYEWLTVEGCGGIFCPFHMTPSFFQEDLIQALSLPTLLVADAGLGTLNRVMNTLCYAKEKNISVRGILLNRYQEKNPMHRDNKRVLEELTKMPILGCISEKGNEKGLNLSKIMSCYEEVRA